MGSPELNHRILSKIQRYKERPPAIEWRYLKPATEYRQAEAQFYANMTNMLEGNPRKFAEVSDFGRKLKKGYFEYMAAVVASRARHRMERIQEEKNLIIGGPEGDSTILSTHAYDPDNHKPFLNYEESIPESGTNVVILAAEVGMERFGRYEQIMPPIYTTPDYEGSIRKSSFTTVYDIATEVLDRFGEPFGR